MRYIPKRAEINERNLTLYGKTIERVKEFKYLGYMVTYDGTNEVDLKHKLKVVRSTFYQIHNLLEEAKVKMKNKIQLLNVVIIAILLYGSET
jgi:hypothetical protein